MKYDIKNMDVNVNALNKVIAGDAGYLSSAFVWSCTPQGNNYWLRQYGNKTDLDIKALTEIKEQYMVHINKPKTWGEMTDAEKGALLLAWHNGKDIEYLLNLDWIECSRVFSDYHAYRIKPEPKWETETLNVFYNKGFGVEINKDNTWTSTHRITFNTVDGKPDCTSIKMEEL